MDRDPTSAMNFRRLGHQMRSAVLCARLWISRRRGQARRIGCAQLYIAPSQKRQGDRFAIALLHQAATLFHKAVDMEPAAAETKAAEVGAKAVVRAEAEKPGLWPQTHCSPTGGGGEGGGGYRAYKCICARQKAKGKGKAKSKCKSSGKRS